jgi:hypothetical protein
MKREHTIEFDHWDDAESFEIALEPEATPFRVTQGKKLKFVATCDGPFKWSVRINKDGAIQLYPESKEVHDIAVYENERLIY